MHRYSKHALHLLIYIVLFQNTSFSTDQWRAVVVAAPLCHSSFQHLLLFLSLAGREGEICPSDTINIWNFKAKDSLITLYKKCWHCYFSPAWSLLSLSLGRFVLVSKVEWESCGMFLSVYSCPLACLLLGLVGPYQHSFWDSCLLSTSVCSIL